MKVLPAFLILFFLLSVTGLAKADEITVTGNDHKGIQEAFNTAKSGDTIIFQAGDYYVKKPLKATGKDLNLTGEGEVNIHFNVGATYGMVLQGEKVVSTKPASGATKGSTRVVLKNVDGVQKGQLISIWNNNQWAPKDQPKQKTGEIYLIKDVDGNTVTLNEPLLRNYSTSDNIEVHDPVEIHVKNLNFYNSNSTTKRDGVEIRNGIYSSVSDCVFKDHGRCALKFTSCWESVIENNEVYNGLMPGNGYGYCIADGCAYITIQNNSAENCRHTVCGTAIKFKVLNREILITQNELTGASIKDSNVVDSHEMTINYIVTKNVISPQNPWAAFRDGTFSSVFTDNDIYGKEWTKRGHIDGGEHIINNTVYSVGKIISRTEA